MKSTLHTTLRILMATILAWSWPAPGNAQVSAVSQVLSLEVWEWSTVFLEERAPSTAYPDSPQGYRAEAFASPGVSLVWMTNGDEKKVIIASNRPKASLKVTIRQESEPDGRSFRVHGLLLEGSQPMELPFRLGRPSGRTHLTYSAGPRMPVDQLRGCRVTLTVTSG